SRRLDTAQVEHYGHAVAALVVDAEVRRRLVRTADLRPHPGVRGLQRPVAQPRPVAADGGVETLAAAHVDVVLRAVDPLHIGTEACAAAEVERQVDAEAARLRDGVDQTPER